MMTDDEWKELHWFNRDEKNQRGLPAFPEPERMSRGLMLLMDSARDYVDRPFVVHYSTDGVHGPDSLHYKADALDGHFEGLSAVEQYLLLEQFNPPGLGFYPYWQAPGVHVDFRITPPGEKAARWWREQSGSYYPITPAVIRRFLNA